MVLNDATMFFLNKMVLNTVATVLSTTRFGKGRTFGQE